MHLVFLNKIDEKINKIDSFHRLFGDGSDYYACMENIISLANFKATEGKTIV